MFIDQLEMLAYKSRGNLNAEEKQLLQQSLVSLRMAFVEELRKAGIPVPEHLTQSSAPPPSPTAAPKIEPAPAAAPAPKLQPAPPGGQAPQQPASPPSAPQTPTPTPAEEESRKRFTKKY
jgi:hypothetical protein